LFPQYIILFPIQDGHQLEHSLTLDLMGNTFKDLVRRNWNQTLSL
jgi:hypothetical protein